MENQEQESSTQGQCPVTGRRHTGPTNAVWWPNQVSLKNLHQPADPMPRDFNYAKEFKSLDLNAVIKDIKAAMTESQDWWPADFGHYGGLMIRRY